jgi:hypothetical protein
MRTVDVPLTILNTATNGAADIGDNLWIGVKWPNPKPDGESMQVSISVDGITYYDMYDHGGNIVRFDIGVADGGMMWGGSRTSAAFVWGSWFIPGRFIKLTSYTLDAAGIPEAQSAERTIQLITMPWYRE